MLLEELPKGLLPAVLLPVAFMPEAVRKIGGTPELKREDLSKDFRRHLFTQGTTSRKDEILEAKELSPVEFSESPSCAPAVPFLDSTFVDHEDLISLERSAPEAGTSQEKHLSMVARTRSLQKRIGAPCSSSICTDRTPPLRQETGSAAVANTRTLALAGR
mmetsp:Transcript_38699/g.96197  ORF Transcript_38699/g.96197 Transcript_38699/m.96197 type:complete len:161 (+) Transcript_38699:522-1004(+)